MNKYFIVILLFCTSLFSNNLKPITLQLQWKYQFQFAGFIAAKENGYYEDIGLDVNFQEYNSNIDSLEDLLSKKTEYAIFNTQLIYKYKKIQKVRLLASYIQKSPLIFISQPEIKNPVDLINKTIMGTNENLKTSSLSQMLDHFFINSNNSISVPHSFDFDAFIDKKIDAMTIFRSNELYELTKNNIPFNILDPYDYGFYSSAINLFTSDSYAKDNKEEVRKFILASNKGWKYALENMDEIISLIHKKYNTSVSLELLKYEAEVTNNLMLRNLYDIGGINKEQILRQYKHLTRNDLLLDNENIDNLLFDKLLHQDPLFSKEELEYLNGKKTILYCVERENSANKIFKAIENDYIKLFSKKLDLETKIVFTNDFDDSLDYLKQERCEVLPMLMKSKNIGKSINYTSSYNYFPIVIGTLIKERYFSDINNIVEKPLGLVKNSPLRDMLKVNYPNVNLIEIDTLEDGIKRVQQKEIYGVIGILPNLSRIIQNNYADSMKISGEFKENSLFSVGVSTKDEKLFSIFEKLIQNISDDKKQQILNKWISIKYVKGFDFSLLLKIIIGILVLIIIFSYFYYKLDKLSNRLKHKNKTIKNINEDLNLAIKEKDDLFKETYHRIKNNFQSIISILWIETFKDDNKSSRPLIENISSRLISLSKVHDLLNMDINNIKVGLEIYIEDIVENLKKGLALEGITFDLSLDSMDINKSSLNILGLILNELITNSSKHAFKDSKGSISIHIKTEEEYIVFIYEDSGAGFTRKYKNSSGNNLIEKFVNSLEDSSLEIFSKNHLKYLIKFKNT